MTHNFLKTLKKKTKTPLITDEDLKLIFLSTPSSAIHNSLSYHIKNNNIVKLKRGIYAIAEADEKFHFHKFTLANSLYSPSYVSFESALSFYNLIPETVHEVTSACYLSRKKMFDTPLGIFSFSHSSIIPFFLEVEKKEDENFIIATPIRALFDLIYSRRRIYNSLKNLDEDFRIDLEELNEFLKTYSANEILELGEAYKKKSTRQLADVLVRGFK